MCCFYVRPILIKFNDFHKFSYYFHLLLNQQDYYNRKKSLAVVAPPVLKHNSTCGVVSRIRGRKVPQDR